MPTLYDADGRPIRSAELEREHARASLAGVRSPYVTSQASGLNPERLARILRAADDGDTEALFILAEEMEIRDLHYGSVLRTRKLAVAGCEIIVEAVSDDARDIEIADALREEVVDTDACEGLVFDLMDGLAKGISLVEQMWDLSGTYWKPTAFKWRDPSWFVWDRDTLETPRLRSLTSSDGEELAPFKWVQHRPKLKSGLALRGGFARMVATSFMLKNYTLRDMMAFLDTYGMPIRLGRYDPQSITPKEKALMLRALANIGTDAAALVPKGMELELISATTSGTGSGEKLFTGIADWWDRQVSKGVLGQTMTTDDGSSRAQAQVHDGVRLDLKKADAREASRTLRRDVATPFVKLNFGADARVPKVTIVVEEPEDLKAYIDTVDVAVGLGVEIEESVVRDRLGIPDPTKGAKLLSKPKPVAPPAPGQKPDEEDDEPVPPKRGKKPAAEDDEDDDALAKNREVRRAVRQTIVAMNRRGQDEIDRLVEEELDAWRPKVAPSIGTLVEQLEEATTPDAARAVLRAAATSMDLERFTDELATAMLKARGIGDARDDA